MAAGGPEEKILDFFLTPKKLFIIVIILNLQCSVNFCGTAK